MPHKLAQSVREMNSGPAQPAGMFAAVNQAANQAVKAVNSAASGAAQVATNVFQNVTSAANSVVKNVPVLNSLIPLATNAGAAGASANVKRNNGAAGAAAPGGANASLWQSLATSPDQGPNVGPVANVLNGLSASANTTASSGKNFSVNALNSGSSWASPLAIFAGMVVVFLVVFAVFNEQIKRGYEYVAQNIRSALGLSTATDVAAQIMPADGVVRELTVPPQPPQAVLPAERDLQQQNIVEKILPPPGGNEVFNVAQNKFTFYDAEPLCKALGAELASYEQVKDAWAKGADWCNYGWVKGQMAVYPTQKDTYEKLQAGPADQQGACGTTGLNGGYFENPEMRFGVNCYGQKPAQSAHDEAQLMEEGKVPRTPASLKVDQMVTEFKKEADSLFVKPFNNEKWASS